MSDKSQIEWTDATWNPTTGCTKVSEGCRHCYIDRTISFRMDGRSFDAPGIGGKTDIQLHEHRLEQPIRWKKPRRIFVNSLSDLFHDEVPYQFIFRVWETMAAAPQHRFQILTKRPRRMKWWLHESGWWREPLPNVWLGTSVEDQKAADLRIPLLLETPAAVRFLSCEPLIGSVDLSAFLDGVLTDWSRQDYAIHWVIAGGESGPDARPMHPEWARLLRDQCAEAEVPFFFKQWGEWTPDIHEHPKESIALCPDGSRKSIWQLDPGDGSEVMRKVGKKRAGRTLDGDVFDEMPDGVS